MLMICFDMFRTNDIYLVKTESLKLANNSYGHFNTVVKNLISAVTKDMCIWDGAAPYYSSADIKTFEIKEIYRNDGVYEIWISVSIK